MNRKELKQIPLGNLPPNAKLMWSTIYEDPTEHICDQDMVYIELGNNLCIDAGQYGINEFFRVDAVNVKGYWNPIESINCLTTKEVSYYVVKLCWKYSQPEYIEIFKDNYSYLCHPYTKGWGDGFNDYPNKNPFDRDSKRYLKYEYGYKQGVEESRITKLKWESE